MALQFSARELMDAFASNEPTPRAVLTPFSSAVLAASPAPAASNIPVRELMAAFASDEPIEEPLSLQVVRYTSEQIEEEESSPSHTPIALFNPLPQGVDSFREYCYQCGGNIFECNCEDGEEEEEEESDELHCDACKWQDLVDTSIPRSLRARGFDRCFCELLIEHGNCSHCVQHLDYCACDRCDHCWNVECTCIPDDTVGFSKKSDDW